MKKNYSFGIYLSLIMMILILVSCGDENEEKPMVNGFYYDGANYLTQSGFVVFLGENPNEGTQDYKLYLHSSGLSWSDDDEEVQGTGHAIRVYLHTSSSTGIPNGTYTYSSDIAENKFTECTIGVDANFIDEEGTFLNINSGTITINSTGDQYNITYSFNSPSGKELTGNFNGSLMQYDLSEGFYVTSSFYYNDDLYSTPNAILVNWGDFDEGITNFDLSIYSDDVIYSDAMQDFTGSGEVISFEMYSSSDTELDEGTYPYNLTGAASTFDLGEVYIDYNFSSWMGFEDLVNGGSVTVSYDEEDHSILYIDYEINLSGGGSISGYYEGTPVPKDYSSNVKKLKSNRNHLK